MRKWLSKDIGFKGAHGWLRNNKPRPELCERCRERPATELSYNNINNKGYSRNSGDYEWLCSSCHVFKDSGSGAVMTKARIHRVREFYKCGAANRRELAKLFKVDQGTINSIINSKGVYQRPEIFKDLIKDLENLK